MRTRYVSSGVYNTIVYMIGVNNKEEVSPCRVVQRTVPESNVQASTLHRNATEWCTVGYITNSTLYGNTVQSTEINLSSQARMDSTVEFFRVVQYSYLGKYIGGTAH